MESRAASLTSEEKMNVRKMRLHIAICCLKYVSNRNIITAQPTVSPFKSSTVRKVGNWTDKFLVVNILFTASESLGYFEKDWQKAVKIIFPVALMP